MIPGITGFEVLRQINNLPNKLKAKIIITTNLDQEDDSRAEIERMADGYLIKAEITPRQLAQIVDDVAEGKQPSQNYSN